jgi:hypothetical protein
MTLQPICTHYEMTVDCSLNQYVLTSHDEYILVENTIQSSHGECILVENTIHWYLMVSIYWLRIQSTVISLWVHINWEYNPLAMKWLWIVLKPWDDCGLFSKPICTHREIPVDCILNWYGIQSTVISWWVHIGWEYNPLSFYGEYILVERTIHSHLIVSTYWL